MINMNYCKFENTFAALKECDENMEANSDREKQYREKLLKLCKKLVGEFQEEFNL